MATPKSVGKTLGFIITVIGLLVILGGIYLLKSGYLAIFSSGASLGGADQTIIGTFLKNGDPACQNLVLGLAVQAAPPPGTTATPVVSQPPKQTPTPMPRTPSPTPAATAATHPPTPAPRTPSPTPSLPSPTPSPYCSVRPACLDANPPCKIPVPTDGWCPTPTPTPKATPIYLYQLKVMEWGAPMDTNKYGNRCVFVQISSQLKPEAYLGKVVSATGVLAKNVFYIVSLEAYKPKPTPTPVCKPGMKCPQPLPSTSKPLPSGFRPL